MEIEKLKESDLFMPIYEYFEELGYLVNGEVKGCDLVAVKDDELIVVELKKTLNLDVILQGVERQKIGDLVYIAAFKPKNFKKNQRFKRICHLLRRLEMGLIFVSFIKERPVVEVVLTAEPFDRVKSRSSHSKRRTSTLKEMSMRKTKTVGGITRTKIITAYREQAIEIAYFLEAEGPTSPKNVKCDNIDKNKIQSILSKNYYGWFSRIDRGIYQVTTQWQQDKKALEATRCHR